MAAKIDIFNSVLDELGDEALADTGEDVKAGVVLNRRWTKTVTFCLSQGSWNFAMETIKAAADTGVTPEFGFTEVFAKPSDWLRTFAVSEDEYLNFPLLDYYDDANFWSADRTPIYIRYVSNDTGLGFELTRWPEAFTRYVELELAVRSCMQLTGDRNLRETLKEDRDKAKTAALNQDAMNEAQPKFKPPGSWSTARSGRVWRRERGDIGTT